MVRVLAPYLIGAFAVAAVIAATVVWFVQTDRDRRELQGARDRLETIYTVKDLENEAANDSDDDLAGSISDVQPGGR